MAVPDAPFIGVRSNGRDVVRVRCEVPAGTTSFKVYRDEFVAATTLVATVIPADLTVPFIYLDAVGGANGLLLHYGVKATNADGDSVMSNDVYVQTEDYSDDINPTPALRHHV